MLKGFFIWPSRFDFISKEVGQVFFETVVILRKSFDVEGDEVYSFMTHAYVPQNCVPHILNTDEIGQRPYENFVAEIINREVIHWAPIKRQNNGMFPSGNKQQSVRILD